MVSLRLDAWLVLCSGLALAACGSDDEPEDSGSGGTATGSGGGGGSPSSTGGEATGGADTGSGGVGGTEANTGGTNATTGGVGTGTGGGDPGTGGTRPGTSCGGMLGLTCAVGAYCDYPLDARCGAADQMGTCQPRPQVCTREYNPVCGCDGTTYGNECEAHAAGTSAAAMGEC